MLEYQNKEKESTFNLNRINLGSRTYNPTIGRMDRVDALSDIMRRHSTYATNFNNPIRFIDPDGNRVVWSDGYSSVEQSEQSEQPDGDIFASNGTHLKNDGVDDHKVYVVDEKKLDRRTNGLIKWAVKDQVEKEGLTIEELNLRAILATLKQSEAGSANPPLDYNSWNNNKNFTEDSYEANPTVYDKHPGKNPASGGSAAGAYQFLERFYKGPDFSPTSQDKAAINNMTSSSYNAAISGNIKDFKSTTEPRWTSLKHWDVPKLQKTFNFYISQELSGKSTIATPVGQLLKK